jgi:cell division protein FtsI (penicillin-binding protein 3)
MLRRMSIFVVLLALLAAGMTYRLVSVQVIDSDRYVAYGVSQRDGFRLIPAARGAVYDRNGQAFAMSVAQPRLVADPAQVSDPVATAALLADLMDLSVDEVLADLQADSRYRVLAKGLTPVQAEQLQELVREEGLLGITLEDEYVRSTPNGELAMGVVGRALPEGQVDTEGNRGGISGVELAFDDLLRGEPGRLSYEKNVWGDPIVGGDRRLEPARQGTDLYLTLDQVLQYEAERRLGEAVLATNAQSAQAVIMRPSTGEILAMASVGSTDDGEIRNTRDNRAVTAVFEPGSTNKIITVAAAMEEGLVQPDTMFEVPDHLPLYDRVFSDSQPHPAAAWSVTDILVTSSNVGTIKIAQELGRERLDGYLRAFGFGATTGLGFPAEEDGIMKPLEAWSGVDIGAVAIGQGISVTALQMLSALNVIANDGVYVAPKLLGAADQGSGQVPTGSERGTPGGVAGDGGRHAGHPRQGRERGDRHPGAGPRL